MKDYLVAYYIGRFQLPHNGHSLNIDHGLQIAEKVVILVGSSNKAVDEKNPFTFEQRAHLLRLMYPQSNVFIEPLNDYYNNDQWFAQVQAAAGKYATEHDTCCLLGQYSDSSSWYLDHFPQWEKCFTKNKIDVHATDIRKVMFEEGRVMGEHLHPKVTEWLENEYVTPVEQWTDKETQFQKTVASYRFHQKYTKKVRDAEKTLGYAIQFMTGDVTVTCCGHVLVIKRGRNPGKDLYALPGGFLKPNETWLDGALRELKEETQIRVSKEELTKCVVNNHHFDNPDRSLRGRIMTMNYHIKLPYSKLPEVRAADDAGAVEWMSFSNVAKNEHLFFEDHGQMIQYFTQATK